MELLNIKKKVSGLSGWLSTKLIPLVTHRPMHSASSKHSDACKVPRPELNAGDPKVSKDPTQPDTACPRGASPVQKADVP